MTMKCNRLMNVLMFTLILFLVNCFTACEGDIETSRIDEETYIVSNELLGYVTNQEGRRTVSNVEFRNEGTSSFYLNSTLKSTQDCAAFLTYDKSVLEAYNEKNQSNYKAFPEQLITMENNGRLTISAGNRKSEEMKISYHSDNTLTSEDTYVIPLSVNTASENMAISQENQNFLIFIKDLTSVMDCNKANGVKIISCMEINDANPLNHLCFKLKNSNKLLVDMVILFAANIKYDKEKQKVYLYNNPNIQHILSNHEKYLKPLQDRGMKILLGIIGDHDRAAVGNLADATAKVFAKEVKAMCDAYQLDGVFMDDEHSEEMHPAPIGFVDSSSKAAARLCYEIKQVMPNRIMAVYVYTTTYSLPAVDGHPSGEFVDYGINDYGRSFNLSGNYPGMSKANMALWSQELNLSKGTEVTESQLRTARDNGYLSHMFFALDPARAYFEYDQLPVLEKIARGYFDDELVYDGEPYKKDW